MKRYLPRVAVLALALVAQAVAELVPIEQFTADVSLARARLSPDGRYIAGLQDINGEQTLIMLDLQDKKRIRIKPGYTRNGLAKEVGSFRWISDRRISFVTTVFDGAAFTGVSAVDCDGKNWVAFAGQDVNPSSDLNLVATQIIHSFDDEKQSVLMLDRGMNSTAEVMYPDVVRVSTLSSATTTVAKNPGNVVRWVPDHEGVVRLGITREGLKHGVIYREKADAPWRKLPPPKAEQGVAPLGFDFDGRRLIVTANNAEKRRGVYFLDLQTGELGQEIASHPRFDIIPERGAPSIDGVALSGPVMSELTETVVGIRFITEGPVTQWIDPGFAAIQAALDKALPQTVNLIISRTRNEKRFLVLAFSDRDPGTYYLFDREGERPVLSRVSVLRPDFPVKEMVPMYPIKYPSRDGETIHGYLTLPAGEQRTGLPLIVMPHGGPFVRDSWQFNPLVQFLANRGYAVLQMNFRGSPGYGTEFHQKGRREIGRGMQHDIEDGVRWAIAKKVADPDRIGIVGGSFGGFAAMFALAHNPELYRCGVSFAGVTNWMEISKERRGEEYKYAYLHFREWIGDPKLEPDFLSGISPVSLAPRITAPLFIVQGKDDKTVPPRQARQMVTAMEKAGRPAQVLYFSDEAHGLRKERNRKKYYTELEAFLAKHLAPRATTVAAAAAP